MGNDCGGHWKSSEDNVTGGKVREMFWERRKAESELEEEVRDHLDRETERLRRQGVGDAEARRRARMRLGGEEQVKEAMREERPGFRMETIWQDVKYGVRQLRRAPGFAFVVVLTLALGIGATAGIFSLVNSVLLRPLPFPVPKELEVVWSTKAGGRMTQLPASTPNFLDSRERNQAFSSLAAYVSWAFTVSGSEGPERVDGAAVSGEFFKALGVKPLIGRTVETGEDRPGSSPTVVLSYGMWQRAYGGDAGVVGKPITLDGESATIAGVMPAEFAFPAGAQLWANLELNPETSSRSVNWLRVIGRRKTGVSHQQALAEMDRVAAQLDQEYPQANAGQRTELIPMKEAMVGRAKQPLVVLLGAIGFVLLIACANVANLLLARATGREKELALRTALGAGRGRLIRQAMTESLVLCGLGGAAGLGLAAISVRLVQGIEAIPLPRRAEIGMDTTVFAFAAAIVVVTGIVFGLLPVMRGVRSDVREKLQEGSRGSEGKGKQRMRLALVGAEVALSLVLLAGAALMLRSFSALREVNPGFHAEGVLTMNVNLPAPKYADATRRADFYQRAVESLRALPGVEAAAAAAYAPMGGMRTLRRFAIEGRLMPESGREPVAVDVPVSPDYFRVMGIPLKAGRWFTEVDTAQGTFVAVVSEGFVQQHFPNENPIGRKLLYYSSRPGAPSPPREIVGVVGEVKHDGLGSGAPIQFYVPQAQSPWGFATFLLRARGEPAQLAGAAKAAIRQIDPERAVFDVKTLEEIVGNSMAERRAILVLLGIFAGVAVALAAVGIYGVMAYAVGRRTQEIGIRMALGAQRGDVLGMVVKQGMVVAGIGVTVGLTGAVAVTRVLQQFLFGVEARDPLTLAVAAVILAGVALAACWVPAWRASRVQPMEALRYE